ncbi:MAG: hypothetical protein U5Q16_00640 [Gammaproteobacteria bacterium]|nr:hypothetical protein [Gammaproteobacteria bacterium]
MFADILRFRSYRYLWWGLASIAAAWALYASHGGSEPPNGGTWQGYVLGTWAALLIVWLAWLGIRKRSYRSRLGTTQGWTSAHVYLGLAVWVLATLHAGFQLGANIHTVAYVLMTVVILSGVAGLYTYMSHPRKLAANRGGRNRSELFAELYELNREGQDLARRCGAEIQTAVRSSIDRTRIGGGVLAQLSGRDGSTFETLEHGRQPNRDQSAVVDLVAQRITRADRRTEVAQLQELLAVLCRRQEVLRRLREDIRLQGWLNAWLYVHVPLTVATIAALAAHIVSTFIYW